MTRSQIPATIRTLTVRSAEEAARLYFEPLFKILAWTRARAESRWAGWKLIRKLKRELAELEWVEAERERLERLRVQLTTMPALERVKAEVELMQAEEKRYERLDRAMAELNALPVKWRVVSAENSERVLVQEELPERARVLVARLLAARAELRTD
jgi:hypothetical protein